MSKRPAVRSYRKRKIFCIMSWSSV